MKPDYTSYPYPTHQVVWVGFTYNNGYMTKLYELLVLDILQWCLRNNLDPTGILENIAYGKLQINIDTSTLLYKALVNNEITHKIIEYPIRVLPMDL